MEAALTNLGDKVLALTEFHVEGQESRMSLGSELGLVCDVAGGRISTWYGFFSHAEALAEVTPGRRPD